MTYYVVVAYIAPCDCQAIAVGQSVNEALNKWQTWITRGDPLECLSDEDASWVAKARSDLRNHGKTGPQNSGCHYRLEILY